MRIIEKPDWNKRNMLRSDNYDPPVETVTEEEVLAIPDEKPMESDTMALVPQEGTEGYSEIISDGKVVEEDNTI